MTQFHAQRAAAVPSANPYLQWPDCGNEELARLYDNNSSMRNQCDLVALRSLSAEAFSGHQGWQVWRWGSSAHEAFDLLLPPVASEGPVPALLFVHGGRWRFNTSRETAFWARATTAMGWAFVGLNFPKLDTTSLGDMVDAVGSGVAAVLDASSHLGLDARCFVLAGHSSGAHLALSAALGLPRPAQGSAPWLHRLRALYLLGGIYDLRPLALCFPVQTLGFDFADAQRLSPLMALDELAGAGCKLPPVMVGAGAQESSEFIRQAHALHWALARYGQVDLQSIDGTAHFDAALDFNRPQSCARLFLSDAMRREVGHG